MRNADGEFAVEMRIFFEFFPSRAARFQYIHIALTGRKNSAVSIKCTIALLLQNKELPKKKKARRVVPTTAYNFLDFLLSRFLTFVLLVF